MPDDRCFRIDAFDVEELRDQTRDQQLIDALSHWLQHFAPKVDDVSAEEHPEGWRQLLTEKQRRAIISTLKLIRGHPYYEHDRKEIESAFKNLTVAPNMG